MNRVPPKPSHILTEAEKAFKPAAAPLLLSEHQLREKAFFENRERLKAERQAREGESKKK